MQTEAIAQFVAMEREFAVEMFFFIAALCFSVSFIGFWLAGKRTEVKNATVIGLFFLGVLCLLWFIAWAGIGLLWVVLGEDEPPVCVIALTPKWVFLFSVFSLLGVSKSIRQKAEEVLWAFCRRLGLV